jgi:hypothetical protein
MTCTALKDVENKHALLQWTIWEKRVIKLSPIVYASGLGGTLSRNGHCSRIHGPTLIPSCQENCDYGRRVPPRWPCDALYQQKLALTSPISFSRSVGTVRWRTKDTDLLLLLAYLHAYSYGISASSSWFVCLYDDNVEWLEEK